MSIVFQTWLDRLCRILPGLVNAVLLTGPSDEGPYNQATFWPEKKRDYSMLSRVTEAALQNRQAVIKTRNNKIEKTGEPLDALAYPLMVNDRLMGVVAMELKHRSQSAQKETVKQVQASIMWLETILLLQGSTSKEQLVNLVDLVAAGLEQDQFHVAATEVTNLLAELFACHRVSLGFMRGNRLRVEALSHSSRIDQQSNLVRNIKEAMVESLDQANTVVYPLETEDTAVITRIHARLAEVQHGAAICTFPLIKNGKAIGALLLERAADRPFPRDTVEQCQHIGMLLGPVLELRRMEERSLLIKILDTLRKGCSKLLGPKHLFLKAGTALATAILIWICVADATMRISCDASVEARICRVVVAPQQGYIAAAHVTAGDLVRQGDLMATLDDQELRIEQRKWQSQRVQLLKEYRKALAGSDRAEVAILRAKRAQAEAQLNLVNQQLVRTSLSAPFHGLVVKGDLSQALGSPVSQGQVLYEVSPINKYRVVLKVDDRDIGLITKGQRGHLKLSGIPIQTIGITIERLTPIATTEEGRNYFRVDALMDSHSDLMRPGMEGISKIEVGQKRIIWIWTRRLVDWLRMFAWERLP